MSKPIILLTAGRQNLYTPRREVQTIWAGCDVDYIKAVLRSGGAPVLMPHIADKDSVHAALSAADGIIFTGGGDVISMAYGEQPHPKSALQDPARDEMEFEAVRTAIEMGLPILGICRGIQVINVALGGSLVQDISSQVPDAVKHYSAGLAPMLLHDVEVVPGSLLAGIVGSTSMSVNSWHHQSVKEIGRGLKVNCRAADGVIEGIESDEDKPILAMQCHPEEIASDYPLFQRFFDWLIEKASKPRE
ncbi:MAG: gamma-glutamyl-gamma-aminobutyrate hydrolase family protein [Armatimonadota bacterium]